MRFDPKINRMAYLSNDKEWIRRLLAKDHDPKRPIGNRMVSELGDVISIALCGLYDEISPLIPKLVTWLDQVIEEKKQDGNQADFDRMTLHDGRALAGWMRDGVDERESWDLARRFLTASFLRGDLSTGNRGIPAEYLDDYLALCYQAGRYEDGVVEYEKYHDNKALSLKKTLPPRKLAYAMCLHELRRQFTVEELCQAGRNMLQNYLWSTWIDRGQYLRAAKWLKIVYWSYDPALTTQQTILKAYDHIQDLPRPDFL